MKYRLKNDRLAVACVSLIILLFSMAGCGGSGNGPLSVDQTGDQPAADTRGSSTGFSLAEPGTGQTPGLTATVDFSGGAVLVRISAEQGVNAAAMLFELNYDAGEYAPLAAQATGAFVALDDSLCLEYLDTPGVVSFAQVPIGGGAATAAAGEVVAEVLFTPQPFTAVRQASGVPVHTGALCPLVFDSGGPGLVLYYNNHGDYDQNGLVSASDLVPIGRLYGTAGPFDYPRAMSVVDGNNNGQIEVADITVIGQNWDHSVTGFNFYGSDSLDDVPVGYADPSTIDALGSVAFADATGELGQDRLAFSFGVADYDYTFYWARPVCDGVEGIPSNLAGPSMVTQLGGTSNAQPTADLSAAYESLEAPVEVVLDATGSSDPDGVLAYYEWDFDGDGLYDGTGSTPLVEHTYNAAGTYAPAVRVIDNLGAWATAEAEPFTATTTEVPNNEPVADVLAMPETGMAPLVVGFIASGSVDSDGWISRYEWDFDGDGTWDLDSGSDPTVINSYGTAGTYAATVRVTDDDGATATAATEIVVTDAPPENQPPVPVFTLDYTYGTVPLEVYFYAGASSDPDGTIVNYEWDLNGDGKYEEYGDSVTNTHVYETAGYHTAALRVTDDQGAQVKVSREIRVNHEAPAGVGWPMAGHDPQHSGVSDVIGPIDGVIDWSRVFGLPVDSDIAVDSFGTLYLSSNNIVHALNTDGSVKWTYENPDKTYGGFAFGIDGSIYFGSKGGTVYAIRQNGWPRWTFETGNQVGTPVVAPDGTIYVTSADYYLYAINPDGSQKWSYLTDGYNFPPAVWADGSVCFARSGGLIYAVDADGNLLWTYDTGASINGTPAVGPDGTIYCAGGYGDAKVFALNADGTLKWTYESTESTVAQVRVGSDGTVYFGLQDGLYALNPDGTVNWTYNTDEPPTCKPVEGNDGRIYIGDGTGDMYVLNTDGTLHHRYEPERFDVHELGSVACGPDGELYAAWADQLVSLNVDFSEKWFYRSFYPCTSPVVSPGGMIYVNGCDGVFRAYNAFGTQQWTYEGTGYVRGTPAIAEDGTIIIGCYDNKLVALNPDGSERWVLPAAGSFSSSPCIREDGIIYIGNDDGYVYAYNLDGTLAWRFATGFPVQSTPVINYDGSMYTGNSAGYMYKFNPFGTCQWGSQAGTNFLSGGTMDIDGTTFVGNTDRNLYAFNPNSSKTWIISPGAASITQTPALRPDGTILVACDDQCLYAVDTDGKALWSRQISEGEVDPACQLSAPAVDAQMKVFISLANSGLYALNKNGDVVWQCNDAELLGSDWTGSPAIGQDGTIYLTINSRLFAFIQYIEL